MPHDLDQASLHGLLAVLGESSAEPGLAYESLRVRLIRFFEWNHCRPAEDWADVALDRMAGRIAAGETILDPRKYVAGIARMLVHESAARQLREQKMISWLQWIGARRSLPDERQQNREHSLAHCLENLSAENRLFLERYYSGDAGRRIQNRQQMAGELGIGLNALRNRALRLRQQLEDCTAGYLARLSGRDGTSSALTSKGRRTP